MKDKTIVILCLFASILAMISTIIILIVFEDYSSSASIQVFIVSGVIIYVSGRVIEM